MTTHRDPSRANGRMAGRLVAYAGQRPVRLVAVGYAAYVLWFATTP